MSPLPPLPTWTLRPRYEPPTHNPQGSFHWDYCGQPYRIPDGYMTSVVTALAESPLPLSADEVWEIVWGPTHARPWPLPRIRRQRGYYNTVYAHISMLRHSLPDGWLHASGHPRRYSWQGPTMIFTRKPQ